MATGVSQLSGRRGEARDEPPAAQRAGPALLPRACGSSLLLLLFALVVVALLAAFTVLGLRTRADARRQAEQRFAGEATLTASLTAAILQTSVTAAEQAAAKQLGSATVTTAALDQLASRSKLAYVILLDSHGRVLASSSGAAASARARRLRATDPQVASALAGRPYLSNVLTLGSGPVQRVVEWALPFPAAAGRRVELEAFDPALLSGFFGSYLAQAAKSGGGAAFILDRRGRVLGDGSGKIAPGGLPKSAALIESLPLRASGRFRFNGSSRFFASSDVQGTSWRVVMTVRTGALYPALAGPYSWFLYVLLAAFGLAGGTGLVFFRRALVAGDALRQTNDELRGLNLTLERRVAERTAAVEERSRELARSNAELEQFSSIASHDLQEPLRKVRMFGDRLRERLAGELPEGAAADLDRMQNAAARMQRLINDLLEFSRVTHRGNAFEPVDLRAVVDEVVADLEARIVELDAHLEISDLPTIEADRTQMRQLFQNLIGNALKFHRDGVPPVVRIESSVVHGPEPRFAGESQPGDRVVITVADNGIGFEQKHAERVFDAFERLNGMSAYEGTGIGLSIVRKIVWRHGGQVTAAGIVGEGATFTVTLPLAPSAAGGNPDGGES